MSVGPSDGAPASHSACGARGASLFLPVRTKLKTPHRGATFFGSGLQEASGGRVPAGDGWAPWEPRGRAARDRDLGYYSLD